jgi:acetyl-CoA acetyltransferase
MQRQVNVVGVGMVPFCTPKAGAKYTDLGAEAVRRALADARIGYEFIQQAYAGYVQGDSACGQRVLYQVGLSGIPIVNVNNYCATGSSALFLARQAVECGACECALAVGFEQMNPGPLTSMYSDRPSPMERFAQAMSELQETSDAPRAARFFGGAGREYQRKYGVKSEIFAKVAVKARAHASKNPNAVFRDAVTVEEVLASPAVFDPLTRLQCCPPTSGGAAAILCSDEFAARHGIDRTVFIAAQTLVTDRAISFEGRSMMNIVGCEMAERGARQAYEIAGVGPEDLDVIELHDCFTTNEVMSYEALGLAAPGEAQRMIQDADNTYGGKYVINPSGGLLSKGHPLGATGLAQCAELVWQLRGQAGARQVSGARTALQHNLGLGGACVITIYST